MLLRVSSLTLLMAMHVSLFEGELEFKLTSAGYVKSVQLLAQEVPRSLLPMLKDELDKMEALGSIHLWPESGYTTSL